jgi:putative tryptophan/tyrosine transport system substrate-binding protein
MTRRSIALVITLTLALLVAPLLADAQPAAHVYRIGWLSALSHLPASDSLLEAFWQGLRELGYFEGQNLFIEYRYAEGNYERLPALAAELVRLPVEVIVAGGAPAIRAAQYATHMIPIVMTGTPDPVTQGFVATWRGQGGNITGVSNLRERSSVCGAEGEGSSSGFGRHGGGRTSPPGATGGT